MRRLLLAADVGGTKIHMGLYRIGENGPIPVRVSTVPTSSYGSLAGALDTFLLLDGENLVAACLGVAGPVIGGVVDAPNLPWKIRVDEMRQTLGLEKVEVINDLVACAWGLQSLTEDKLTTLRKGTVVERGTRALIAPGTGLGQAIIPFCAEGYLPIPSEGGHTDFAPANQEQDALLAYLRGKGYDHVSWEIVASGPGIKLIYDFLAETERFLEHPEIKEKLAIYDPSSVISDEGLKGTDPASVRALELYTEILGAACGNLALTALSTGGLYIGGGVAPKIVEILKTDRFLRAFAHKGRMSWLAESFSVSVITEEKAALHGAALCAEKLSRQPEHK